MNAAVVCDGKELETYDVKQEGSSLTAFVASEAGKVRTVSSPTVKRRGTNRFAIQQFKITFSNELTTCAIAIFLYIDGRQLQSMCLRPGQSNEFLGPYETECSIRPLKFQELQLVGTFTLDLSFIRVSHSLLAPKKDPDLEDAPVAPEMGTIELKGYRCQLRGPSESSSRRAYEGLHLGRISERSKKAGWHHVGFVPSLISFF